MNEDALLKASDLLYRRWMAGEVVAELPEDCRPTTRREGYAIQALLEARMRMPLFGWKIAATSAAGQAHINVDGPLAGRLFVERVIENGGLVPTGANRMAVAEVEFAYRMGCDCAPRAAAYSIDETLAAVASVHAAIEIPDSRYADFVTVGAPQLIADNACAHYFVAAEATRADWRSLDLAAHPVVGRVKGRYEREGIGANALGDPRIALTWLVNELSGLGICLRKGQMVTTGTCVQPLEIGPGDVVVADLGVLGTASVRFPH
jgi:2-keto-4-pentenoate hydratase